MTSAQPVRVRFAPSPTGLLHIGGARTTLFNWLFARKHDGAFILRIEDTDTARSRPEYERDLLEQLHWLGLDWDEGPAFDGKGYRGAFGPYRQSERLDLYETYVRKLLEQANAYHCFCTTEELEGERQSMMSQGIPPRYNGKCRELSKKESEAKLAGGAPSVIRFKTPEEKISFTDLIRGKVTFDGALMGDMVITKSVREPLYNFAAAVDDHLMQISHVIRAEEHLANTPKQIMFQRALDFDQPTYAHLPLILNPDRSKMSKRFVAVAVSQYRQQGYLPEALVNFMSLLGWHPTAEQAHTEDQQNREREIFTRDEIVKNFDLARVQKAGAVFNVEKLDWINAQHLRAIDATELLEQIRRLNPIPKGFSNEQLEKIVVLVRDRMKKLSDFAALTDYFFALPTYDATLLIWKQTSADTIRDTLRASYALIENAPDEELSKEKLKNDLAALADERGRGEVFWPLRVALSGKDASPGPLEIMEILGKRESMRRISLAIEKLK